MQGYDFFVLNQDHNVTLQIGGSDQWGNMTAGTELLRRKADKTGHVITVPLITDATGKKFGKSEGNAVWLNPEKTSPYEMYQFWMNVMDADAVRFLKIFTFLSLDEIEDIRKQFEAAPHERLAQKVLAREVVTLVHGEEAYQEALNITEQLFAGNIKNLSVKELKQGLRGVPNYQVKADENHNIVELLVSAGVVNSKRQAREDVQNGAIYVNGDRIQDLDYVLSDVDKLENELTVIRRGKKKILCSYILKSRLGAFAIQSFFLLDLNYEYKSQTQTSAFCFCDSLCLSYLSRKSGSAREQSQVLQPSFF